MLSLGRILSKMAVNSRLLPSIHVFVFSAQQVVSVEMRNWEDKRLDVLPARRRERAGPQ
jgi:hypothetical protein